MSQPRKLFLTRHAHKNPAAVDPFSDEDVNLPLSEQGEAQAQHLADLLAPNGISAIYITQFVRTRKTAEPLAVLTHVAVAPLPMSADVRSDPAALASYVSNSLATIFETSPPGNVLIVGHDMTISALLQQLVPESPPIEITGFGDLFIIELGTHNRPPSIKY